MASSLHRSTWYCVGSLSKVEYAVVLVEGPRHYARALLPVPAESRSLCDVFGGCASIFGAFSASGSFTVVLSFFGAFSASGSFAFSFTQS